MYDVAIIGCGIIGAATAYELSRYDLKIAVLEKENDIADGTTKANSAIVHEQKRICRPVLPDGQYSQCCISFHIR